MSNSHLEHETPSSISTPSLAHGFQQIDLHEDSNNSSQRLPLSLRSTTTSSSTTLGVDMLSLDNRDDTPADSLSGYLQKDLSVGGSLSDVANSSRSSITIRNSQIKFSRTRQVTLPPKDPKEDQKHLKEYEETMKASKKKEEKQARKDQKRKEEKEKRMRAALKYWEEHLLINWEKRKDSKKTHDIWWQGLPSGVRGKVWCLAIGNELKITPEVYDLCKERARTLRSTNDLDSPSAVAQIELDITRTFPTLLLFQENGPYYDKLKIVLEAFACFRSDIGYVQGMSYLAATLLLNMDEFDAFVCMANLLKGGLLLIFYMVDMDKISAYFKIFTILLNEQLPDLANHFMEIGIKPDYFLYEWFLTLYAKPFPFEISTRIWDLYFLYHDPFLFRLAISVLKHMKDRLLCSGFDECIADILHLPGTMGNTQEEELFEVVKGVKVGKEDLDRVARAVGLG